MDIQKIALEILDEQISKESYILFKDRWLCFYFDDSGERGHYLIKSKMYGLEHKNQYHVKRVLSFVNKEDEGKDKARLCEIDLNKCKVVSIKEKSVEFENFEIYFKGNTATQRMDFKYI